MSTYMVSNVTGVWGMLIANLQTGQIITSRIPGHPPVEIGLLHGIGWTPNESEVWESSTAGDPQVYIWDMLNGSGFETKVGVEKRSRSVLAYIRYRG
jgi:hypothetical protein